MSWSTALTAVANTGLTAGQWNASVRDNLNETTPAVATTKRRVFVTDGTNRIAERAVLDSIINDTEETTSTTYTDLDTVGPQITLTTGQHALVWMSGQLKNSGANDTLASTETTGDTVTSPNDNRSLFSNGGTDTWSDRCSVCTLHSCEPGVTTFTMKFKVTGGTGTLQRRRMVIMGL